MILSDVDIRREMALRRVVIAPFCRQNLNPNSYDVTLGNHFLLLKYLYDRPYYWLVTVPDGRPLFLPAGETVLAMTKEIAGGTGNITATIHAKSSTRRQGVSICDDAGVGDVGYVNHWTMELTANTLPYAVRTPGQRIAQVVFAYVCTPPERPYAGQYVSADWPGNMVPAQDRTNVRSIPYVGPETLLIAAREIKSAYHYMLDSAATLL